MSTPPLIVFTDLDGTLLDHETYSFDAARPALGRLAELGIPLIIASSKTAVEISDLQDQIGYNAYPAIVENGAGLLEPGALNRNDARTYERLRGALSEIPLDLRQCFEGFADLGRDGIARVTGLTAVAAAAAADREFSEPGLWHGSEQDLDDFVQTLGRKGIHAQRGGRFLTISYGGTKADRMDEICARFGNPPRLALGDAPNDVEMLEAADHGILIANPHGASVPNLPGEAAGLIRRTSLPGPLGWNSAVLDLLYQLNL